MNYNLLSSTWIIIVGFQILWHYLHSRWHFHCIKSSPLQTVRNLRNVSAVKNQVISGFFKYISGLLSGSLAVYEVLALFGSILSLWPTDLPSFMKQVSMCLLYIDPQLNDGKERMEKKHSSYIGEDMDWRNSSVQINLWLRNLELCFYC